jgi:endonuclease/exonuclease/phosphatase family metal-dependent hydrolase
MFFAFILAGTLVWGAQTAPSSIADKYPVPSDDQTIISLSSSHDRDTVANSFELLVWNVHKGEDKALWAYDLNHLSRGVDFVLLQEGMNDDFMPSVLRGLNEFSFSMAISFVYQGKNKSTGVITGYRPAAESLFFRRSPIREPILKTPKMTLFSVHRLASGRPLLVANIHGINFVTNAKFRRQILDLVPTLKAFDGDIVFAGDFNTWNPGRLKFLTQTLEKVGLTELVPRLELNAQLEELRLDHIFVRGCTGQAWMHTEIKSSDHKPLRARLNCE